MNRIHRLVWNAARGAWQAVCETATASGKDSRCARTARTAGALTLLAALGGSPVALAGPQGGQVTLGVGSVAQDGATTTITQTSQQLAIDWQSFNIGAAETVRFVQPSAQAVALNRVLGADPSSILGRLSANGQLFLLNPNGVLFGANARVDVGGLVASTLSLSNEDLAAGRIQLQGSRNAGAVSNAGRITAADGGYVVLAAPQVHNTGDITTRLGTTALAAGEHVTLQLQGGSLLGYRIERGALDALVEQAGRISVDGGAILIEAKALDALSSAVVNHSGVSLARTVQERAGRIVLMGDLEVGRTTVAGTLDASAPDGGNGGFIETSAAVVKVADGASVTTRSQGGQTGTWLIDPTDFTIAATGGDISGATLSTQLANNNVILDSVAGALQGDGSLYVRDEVRWSSNRLTLRAQSHIHLYQDLVGSGSAQLTMAYGQASADGGTSDYHLHNGTRVYLPEGPNLSLQKGSAGANQKTYQVITQGTMPATAGNVAFTGMNNDTNGFYALGSSISNVRFEYEDQDGIVKGLFNGQFHGLGHQLLKFINNQSTDMLDALGGPPVTNYSVGLFREIGAAGVLRDFQMVEGFFSLIAEAGGYPCYVGTVAGINNGLIHKVYSNAELRGLLGISAGGGLVGVNNGTIRQSQYGKLSASTRGGDFVSNFISNPGLIAGLNTGLIEDSVSTSGMRTYRSYTDRSYTDVIEIAGSNTGTINRSYVFKGANQVIDNNGVRTPTTTEMQQAATFAGWDIGTDPDGDSVWRIFEGQSTPLLRDFRRRVNIQARRAYNGEIQTESTASGRNAGYHAAAPDLRPLGDEITGGLTIDPVSLVVTSSDLHRVYDGTTQANAAQAVVVNGQLFGTDILSGGSFAFTDRNAGTGKTVTVSGVTVDDGNNGANYTLSQVNNTTSTITAAPLQIAADAAHKTYDGTTNAHSSWQLVGGTLHGTDSIGSVTLVYDNRHAGTGKALNLQSAVVSDGNNGANYALSLIPNLASSITAAPLQIAPDAAHKAFDGTTDASTTWRIGSGTVFAGDSVDDVVVHYDSPDVGVNKRLNLTSVAVNDGNSGANYQVSLADNAASSIALPDAEAARLEQSQTTARQTSGPAARSSNPFAQLLVLDCGMRLPGGVPREDCL